MSKPRGYVATVLRGAGVWTLLGVNSAPETTSEVYGASATVNEVDTPMSEVPLPASDDSIGG